ncbi:DUF937 domain-containing protein [Ramlibacter sp.]|uniref:DUF937 domain-containing protein n=1 Tax=Ramlibacter sp. TaxID=1917967 RepID=UPI002D3E28B8|nr:DUF937 domain-containing protein [Ramlibacter sp.]HYD77222.1 DUF937 domain-containing protein [Ramlibacter sp.]
MDITDLLSQTGGLDSIARDLGISPQQAASGASALAPAILGGFQKRAQEPATAGGGLPDLLSSLGGGGLLEQLLSPAPTGTGAGNQVLGQIFGSKDVSRAVAQDAAGKSGLDADLLKKMLPLLAMAVTGLLAKGQAGSSGGGLGGLLGGLLGGGSTPGGGLGGLGGLLDANGDGNPLDDVLRMAGKLGR